FVGPQGEQVFPSTVGAPQVVVKADYKVVTKLLVYNEPRYRSLRATPVRRATTSAATPRGDPAATSSATALNADPRSAAGAAPGAITSVTSPFGASTKRSASSEALPRATSSKRFVNSRHTATARPGSDAASERSDAGSLLGDSNATSTQP